MLSVSGEIISWLLILKCGQLSILIDSATVDSSMSICVCLFFQFLLQQYLVAIDSACRKSILLRLRQMNWLRFVLILQIIENCCPWLSVRNLLLVQIKFLLGDYWKIVRNLWPLLCYLLCGWQHPHTFLCGKTSHLK